MNGEESMICKGKSGTVLKIKRVLFVLVAVLFAAVLALSAFSGNSVNKSRENGELEVIEDASFLKVSGENFSEYRFNLSEIAHDRVMAFYINHHNIRVFIGGECVYSLSASDDDSFLTSGGTWVSVPIYREDGGKEVLIEIEPLYDNLGDKKLDIFIGSEIAVHNVTLHTALPAMMLCMCVVFAGLLLMCLAVYHTIKGRHTGRLYALGLLAIFAGIWRFSYDRVAYILFPDYSVLVYTSSVLSLMMIALSMLNSLERNEKSTKFIKAFSCVYCVVYAVQLALQAVGIADIRESLILIHATIVISAAAFVADGVLDVLKPKEERKEKVNFSWVLGLGVVVDLVLYYSSRASFTMIFTLVAILCYSVLEGIQLLVIYIEQKTALEEMETQLTLSRTTTMMSQIRSHFVFNILNAISGMCKYDPEMADETVVRFARYLRNNIDIMEKDGNIPFSADLKQVEDYVALEQVRFGDKIEFYTDIETDDFMIPPLIIQPVVENAIKHGVSKKQGNGSIILRTFSKGDKNVITVEDDGVGFDLLELDKEKSVGVRNIRFRLKHLVNGELDIQSEIGKGTLVTITIPKEGK